MSDQDERRPDGKPEDQAAKGIECPRCGCDLCPVAWTRRHKGFTQRSRVCHHCGTRFQTREKALDDSRGPLGMDFTAG